MSRRFIPACGRREGAVRWPIVLMAAVLVTSAVGCSDGGALLTDPDRGPTSEGEDGYNAILLATPGAARSNGWVLNDAGVAAGWSDKEGGRAMRWEQGIASDFMGADSGTRGINNMGAVVGWVRHQDGIQRAFVYADGVRTDLESLIPGVVSNAGDINDSGTVVGVGPTEDGRRAMVWHRTPQGTYGAPLSLQFGSSTQIPHINARGDIVFSAQIWGVHRPAIWKATAGGSYEDPNWLGRPTDESYYAMDMNDQGVVVGFRQPPWADDPPMAVVWLPGAYDTPVDLGIGEAWSINEKNQIVGVTGGNLPVFGGASRRPTLWFIQADGSIVGPRDISTPEGFQSGAARGINEDGTIIGSSWGPGPVSATLWVVSGQGG